MTTQHDRASVRELAERMAADLRNVKVDLNNERAVYSALQSLRYTAGEIITAGDDAIALAKSSTKNLLSIVGDGVAAIFAIGVWLAWYVVLCPAGA
jgi:hypothetical protein